MIATDAGVVIEVLGEPGQALARGQTVLRLADLGAFQVEASAPASASTRLAPNLPVRMRLDGGSLIDGRVATVKPAVDAGAVHFDIALDDPRHPELRPNRRVDAWVVLERRDQAVRLPSRGLALSGRRVPMWVIEGNRAVRRDLTLGASGPEWTEIVGGLAPGEQVVISGIAPDSPPTLRLKNLPRP
jgi:HlyD family secretion protein